MRPLIRMSIYIEWYLHNLCCISGISQPIQVILMVLYLALGSLPELQLAAEELAHYCLEEGYFPFLPSLLTETLL